MTTIYNGRQAVIVEELTDSEKEYIATRVRENLLQSTMEANYYRRQLHSAYAIIGSLCAVIVALALALTICIVLSAVS